MAFPLTSKEGNKWRSREVPWCSHKSCDHWSFVECQIERVSSSLLSLQFCLIIPPLNWSKHILNWNGAPLSGIELCDSYPSELAPWRITLTLDNFITNLSKKAAHKFHIRLPMKQAHFCSFLRFFMEVNLYSQKCEVGCSLLGGLKLGEEPGLRGWFPLLPLLCGNLSSERAAPQEKELPESIHPWKTQTSKVFWV